MKKPSKRRSLQPLLFLFLSTVALAVQAIDRGVNYDPTHSQRFSGAMQRNDLQEMRRELWRDLDKIKYAGFSTIRTLHADYWTGDGRSRTYMADLVCSRGLKVMIGVHEFSDSRDNCTVWCEAATQAEVVAAVSAAREYPVCVVGVTVGNDDITNWNFTVRHAQMEARILRDVRRIKQALPQPIPVGTVQQDGALLRLASYNDELSNDLIGSLDFVGANIFPYWNNDPFYGVWQAQSVFLERYNALTQVFSQPIVVTGEGWPSNRNTYENPNASLESERTYYEWWQSRANTDTFSSYYFTFFDSTPTGNGADLYFGLCRSGGGSKILPC